jgi:hypothetical protein
MTEKNIEKLAQEGERLLIKELEDRYKNLRKMTDEFLTAKGKGLENTRIKPETYLAFGPFVLPNSRTPKSNYREALEDYKLWAEHVNNFGLSIVPFSIDVKSYEEVLK